MVSSKKGNIQAAARRRILAIDFNDKVKLDTSNVKVHKRNDLEHLLTQGMPMRRSYKEKSPWGMANYRQSVKQAQREYNRDQTRTGKADLRRRSDD